MKTAYAVALLGALLLSTAMIGGQTSQVQELLHVAGLGAITPNHYTAKIGRLLPEQSGLWVIGGRPNQRVVALKITSFDNGDSMKGTVIYEKEGVKNINAVRLIANQYEVMVQKDPKSSNSWAFDGIWILGPPGNFSKVLDHVLLSSSDGGDTFTGQIKFFGERYGVDFSATRTELVK